MRTLTKRSTFCRGWPLTKQPDGPRYVIRAANGKDAGTGALIRDMHDRIFEDTAPQVVTEEGHWWIAWKGKEAAGFAGLRLSKTTPGTGYLHRSGVLPRHRGHGLQVRLIRMREAKARELGQKRMVTDTTDNIASANSLIRAGYRLYRPEGKWAFVESLYWEKEL